MPDNRVWSAAVPASYLRSASSLSACSPLSLRAPPVWSGQQYLAWTSLSWRGSHTRRLQVHRLHQHLQACHRCPRRRQQTARPTEGGGTEAPGHRRLHWWLCRRRGRNGCARLCGCSRRARPSYPWPPLAAPEAASYPWFGVSNTILKFVPSNRTPSSKGTALGPALL